MKKFLSVLVVLLLSVSLLCGCGETEPEKTSFKVGETATVENVNYTLTKVKTSKGSDFDKPASGKEYVIVTIKIENNSEETVSFNYLDWKMENSEGQLDEPAFTIEDTDTNLGSGDLKAGGSKTGTIVFEEPKGDEGLKLHYYGNIFSSDESDFHFVLGK